MFNNYKKNHSNKINNKIEFIQKIEDIEIDGNKLFLMKI